MRIAWVSFTRADTPGDLAYGTTLNVQIPETAEECQQGLAGVPLFEGYAGMAHGMMFDLRALRGAGSTMNFTTVGMFYALDFLVVEGGRVTMVLPDVLPGVPHVLSASGVDYVVEAPGGWAKRKSVAKGSTVYIA